MLKQAGHIKNTVILMFRHVQCLHLTNSEVAWVPASNNNNPDYFPDYLPFLMSKLILRKRVFTHEKCFASFNLIERDYYLINLIKNTFCFPIQIMINF